MTEWSRYSRLWRAGGVKTCLLSDWYGSYTTLLTISEVIVFLWGAVCGFWHVFSQFATHDRVGNSLHDFNEVLLHNSSLESTTLSIPLSSWPSMSLSLALRWFEVFSSSVFALSRLTKSLSRRPLYLLVHIKILSMLSSFRVSWRIHIGKTITSVHTRVTDWCVLWSLFTKCSYISL